MSNLTHAILSVIRDLIESENSFFRTAAVMQEPQRSGVLANHSRTTHEILELLKHLVAPTSPPTRFVVNMAIPRTANDSIFEDVLVTPTSTQMAESWEENIPVTECTCAICQEPVTEGTRLRNCLHTFHAGCITNWFAMSSRCPVCRDDVRMRRQSGQSESSVSDERSHLSPY